MKKTTLIIGFALIFSVFLGFNNVSAEHMDEFPTMECTDPTETVTVSAIVDELKFDKTEVKVPKNTCVEIVFVNPDVIEHDFTIIDEADEEWVHMDAINTDEDFIGPYGTTTNHTTAADQEQGKATHWYMTPNKDITFKAFCEVPGHEAAGMHLQFVVGAGTATSPGFEFPLLFLGMFALIFIAKTKKK